MDEPERPRHVEMIDFAPARVESPARRSRTPFVVAGWVVALGAVVAVGTLGTAGPRDTGPAAAAAVVRNVLTASPAASAGPDLGEVGNPGRLGAGDPQALTVKVDAGSGKISITGTILLRDVAAVSISVLNAEGRAVATRVVDVADPQAGIRPGRQPAFAVRISLPPAVLGTALLVKVDAYDGLGASMGSAVHWLGMPTLRVGTEVLLELVLGPRS